MSKPIPPTYSTTNWRACNTAVKQRGSLLIWFDPATQWLATPTGKRGRQAVFSDAAIQTCLTLRALFGLPLRQVTGMVTSLLALAGLDWPVPDYSTLCHRQKGLAVAIAHRPGTGALHLLIDIEPVSATGSSEPARGIKAEGCGEWCAKKHGPSKPRLWRKVHLGIDAETLEIRAIEVTGAGVGPSRGLKTNHCRAMDAPMLPELLEQIASDQPIGKVSADGAYVTRAWHEAIAGRGAIAVIPTRRNGRPWQKDTPGAQARNDILRTTCRLGRTIWRRWSGYHQRSLVETKMHCFKLLGERVRPRDFDRQVAELQIRPVILNRFTARGTPIPQRIG